MGGVQGGVPSMEEYRVARWGISLRLLVPSLVALLYLLGENSLHSLPRGH